VWLIIFMNILAFILALIFGIGYYKKKKKEKVSQIRAELWGTVVFLGVMIFFNGVIVYSNFIDDRREKNAFNEMEEKYKEEGIPDQETFKNLKLSIKRYNLSSKRYYAVYVANFNEKATFTGNILITVKDDNKKVGEIKTEQITLKPGEKRMIDSYKGPKYSDKYSYKWIGELK
jgi:hypothetical protein